MAPLRHSALGLLLFDPFEDEMVQMESLGWSESARRSLTHSVNSEGLTDQQFLLLIVRQLVYSIRLALKFLHKLHLSCPNQIRISLEKSGTNEK